MMIKNDENIVIVCGMAHTGTTIVTHILRQHPELILFKNGSEEFILENDILLTADTEKLKKILKPDERIILKRPWVETNQKHWLLSKLPNAYYIYCIKDKEKTIESWSRENSYVSEEFRSLSFQKKSEAFDKCYTDAMDIKGEVDNFFIIHNEELIKSPKKIFSQVNDFLKISQFEYDVSDISKRKPIKKKLNPDRGWESIRTFFKKVYSKIVK